MNYPKEIYEKFSKIPKKSSKKEEDVIDKESMKDILRKEFCF